MKAEGFEISLSFDQILELVRQPPVRQKIKLSKELEKETIASRLTELLKSFRTNEINQEDIDREVEYVRIQRYEKKKS